MYASRIGRSLLILVAVAASTAGCGVIPDPIAGSGPSDTVRRAFDMLVAHDLLRSAELVCPAQRDPSALPMTVPGIFGPLAAVPTGSVAETLALIELDARGVVVEDVEAVDGTVLVPVRGNLRLRLDPAEVEAAVRAAAAGQGEAVDEAQLTETLAAIKAGPSEVDVGREMGSVQVMRFGDAWLICEPLPSTAPVAPPS
jgi:hypothetical protein